MSWKSHSSATRSALQGHHEIVYQLKLSLCISSYVRATHTVAYRRSHLNVFGNEHSHRSALFLFCGIHVGPPSCIVLISRPCVPTANQWELHTTLTPQNKNKFDVHMASVERFYGSCRSHAGSQPSTSFQGNDASWHFTRTFLHIDRPFRGLVYCARLPLFHLTPVKCVIKFILGNYFLSVAIM